MVQFHTKSPNLGKILEGPEMENVGIFLMPFGNFLRSVGIVI
jgi:hypothetical protein